jgi:membrane protein implicated in regulation of membrane protease activity
MVGQEAVVVEDIGGRLQGGHVRIAGESWPAVSDDGSKVRVGATVRVVGLRRATLVVAAQK